MRRHIAANHEIETKSGLFVDVHEPKPDTIRLDDIAHALSQTCRYGGHCLGYYSVATHAVLVSERLEQKRANIHTQIAGLHHDDAEAYLGDIPRPMKPLLGEAYELLTDRMDAAIMVALDLPNVTADEQLQIKAADMWALFLEANHLLPSQGRSWMDKRSVGRILTPGFWHGSMRPDAAAALYLRRHAELMRRLAEERSHYAV